jgi:hypothetical protein
MLTASHWTKMKHVLMGRVAERVVRRKPRSGGAKPPRVFA